MIDPTTLDWEKMDGLVPAIVQDPSTGTVLMLGYMDESALAATIELGKVTFFSRSKNRRWTKGETSGNFLELVSIASDCDSDALLVKARPLGPTCHLGSASCFGAGALPKPLIPYGLEEIVADRASADPTDSYTARLVAEGMKRTAQKVGEEGVEVALAAVSPDKEGLVGEVADLLYHLTVVLRIADTPWSDVEKELLRRHQGNTD